MKYWTIDVYFKGNWEVIDVYNTEEERDICFDYLEQKKAVYRKGEIEVEIKK